MPELKNLGERLWQAFNAHDVNQVASLYTTNCTLVEPGGSFRGREQAKMYFQGYVSAFPDGRITVVSSVESGDSLAMELQYNGTHTGVLRSTAGEAPPTGKRLSLPFSVFLKARGGLITSHRGYYDMADFMAQLGLLGSKK
jgi:predicted ester cyclase